MMQGLWAVLLLGAGTILVWALHRLRVKRLRGDIERIRIPDDSFEDG